MSTSTENSFKTAIGSLQAGRTGDAERQLGEVLRREPKHPAALNLMGALLANLGRFSEAEHYLASAIAINAASDATFSNYGVVLKALKRPVEALDCFNRALALNPSVAENWNNCGTALNDLDRSDEAIVKFERAVALQPNYAEAFYNTGKSLTALRRHADASAAYDRALALKPDLAEAWLARGISLSHLRRDDDAMVALRRAYALKPGLIDTVSALVRRLLSRGEIAEALTIAWQALAARETPETTALVGLCLTSPVLRPDIGDVRPALLRALQGTWARPSALAPACAVFLKFNDAIRTGMEHVMAAWPELPPPEQLAAPSNLAAIAGDPLLQAMLQTMPVHGVELERFATWLRVCLLTAAQSADHAVADPVMALSCALARQCTINNYVFAQSAAETAQAHALRDGVTAALASGADIPALTLVAVAAYLPLRTLPDAQSLLRRSWPAAVRAVLVQQIDEPREEQRLRASTPALTAIDDDTTVKVRDQYEENPYPQWVKPDPSAPPKSINALIRDRCPAATFVPRDTGGDLAVLVAGCGTGRHAIDAARKFTAARVLAIDISLASLGYAQRQTQALGLTNIDFAQADIMKLASIGRTFDVVEAAGVLHHLADPFAGWRVLLSLLRPGGFMLLGFYSEIARQDIVAARDFIAARGYRPTKDDIRRCRQELFEAADGSLLKNVTFSPDFFSLSDCRDLLFHVQEHRLTLPQIATFLAENDLQLLGFDIDPPTQEAYASRFPHDVAMTDLNLWHQYETDHPSTFAAMYQFWVQKRPSAPGA